MFGRSGCCDSVSLLAVESSKEPSSIYSPNVDVHNNDIDDNVIDIDGNSSILRSI